jgi:putative PIN family toxin of toxin-antitoxin system
MRAVLDTNIVVSALIAPAGKPAAIIDAWPDGKFTLLTCAAQVDELRSTLQKPRVAELVKPHKAGRLVNQVKKLAEDIYPLPRVKRSPDPTDDFLPALSEAGKADYLVTGDKSGLLALGRHKSTQIFLHSSPFPRLLNHEVDLPIRVAPFHSLRFASAPRRGGRIHTKRGCL